MKDQKGFIWVHIGLKRPATVYGTSRFQMISSDLNIFSLDIRHNICTIETYMDTFSTRQAAKRLGLTHATLSRYIAAGKIPAPKTASSGGMTIHFWTEAQIEQVRKLLPKIANGRKTRHQKQKKETQGKTQTKQ